jgi:CRP/FNR family transcriptional regulator, cyclic AMP receptor protein
MQMGQEQVNAASVPAYRKGEFFTKLSAASLRDLESLLIPVSCPAHKVLFSETQPSNGVYVIMQGEVKLSINSRDGRRLSFRIAKTGEVLGLSATLSGGEYEMTAETLYPAKVAHVSGTAFLPFIARHPEVYEIVAREMIRSFNDACEQMRTVCLASSVPERLARLLLVWSDSEAKTGGGVRCRLSLTHEEIGEFIGASRESVTRTFSKFKHRRLVAQHGATLMIPSRNALEAYARS